MNTVTVTSVFLSSIMVLAALGQCLRSFLRRRNTIPHPIPWPGSQRLENLFWSSETYDPDDDQRRQAQQELRIFIINSFPIYLWKDVLMQRNRVASSRQQEIDVEQGLGKAQNGATTLAARSTCGFVSPLPRDRPSVIPQDGSMAITAAVITDAAMSPITELNIAKTSLASADAATPTITELDMAPSQAFLDAVVSPTTESNTATTSEVKTDAAVSPRKELDMVTTPGIITDTAISPTTELDPDAPTTTTTELHREDPNNSQYMEHCLICHECFQDMDQLRKLNCGCECYYHFDCIRQWLFNQRLMTCPVCRANVGALRLQELEAEDPQTVSRLRRACGQV